MKMTPHPTATNSIIDYYQFLNKTVKYQLLFFAGIELPLNVYRYLQSKISFNATNLQVNQKKNFTSKIAVNFLKRNL